MQVFYSKCNEILLEKNSKKPKFFTDSMIQFFTDPIIKDYLTRKDITFEDSHPKLEPASESGLNDEYELMIYNYWGDLFIFRNKSVRTKEFYLQGIWTCNANGLAFNKLFGPIPPSVEISQVLDI